MLHHCGQPDDNVIASVCNRAGLLDVRGEIAGWSLQVTKATLVHRAASHGSEELG